MNFGGYKRALTALVYKSRYTYYKYASRRVLPELTAKNKIIVDNLNREGIYVCSLTDIDAGRLSEEMLDAADRVFRELSSKNSEDAERSIEASQERIDNEKDLLLFGLGKDILDIVVNYCGTAVAYRGLTVRRDLANGRVGGTRLWHRDSEDVRAIKVIIYLSDVTSESGPFEYIRKSRTPSNSQVSTVSSSRVLDAAMEALVPRSEWRQCLGPRGTVIFVDTCSLYHKGALPLKQDRCALFYCYNTAHPSKPQWCEPMFNRERLKNNEVLSSAQLDAISYDY